MALSLFVGIGCADDTLPPGRDAGIDDGPDQGVVDAARAADDLAVGPTVDSATSNDAAPPIDAAVAKTGCRGALSCYQKCSWYTAYNLSNSCPPPDTEANCVARCVQGATPAGGALLSAFEQCMFGTAGACPTIGVGVCNCASASFNADQCTDCLASAVSPTGACEPARQACVSDLP